MSLYLLVGGNRDGERMEIPDLLQLIYCPNNPLIERSAIEDLEEEEEGVIVPKQLYRKVALAAGGAYFEVFKYEGITEAQLMSSLIAGYTFTWKRKEE